MMNTFWQRLRNWFAELMQSFREQDFFTVVMLVIIIVFAILLILVSMFMYRFLIFSWLEFAWKWPASFFLTIVSVAAYCFIPEWLEKRRQRKS